MARPKPASTRSAPTKPSEPIQAAIHPASANPARAMAAPATAQTPQIDALTGLRGIAAWFVVFYHIRLSLTDLLPDSVIDIFARGYLAVDFFFLLSGFVMWLSYGERFARDGLRQARPFLWKRFARVWPLHALMLAAFIVFVGVLAFTGRSTEGYPLHELPLHIVLMQNWGFTSELSWNHPAWSISTELAAYLMFPFLVLAVPWQRLGQAAAFAAVAGLLAGLALTFWASGEVYLGGNIAKTGLLRCLFEFAAGVALARLWQCVCAAGSLGENGASARTWLLGSVAIAAFGLAFGLPETMIAPACFATLLMACALGRGPLARMLASPVLVWIGETSYATYLMHFLAFILFKILFVGPDLQIGWLGLFGFCLGVQALAAILYSGFEKPAQRLLNSLIPRATSAA